MKAHRTVQWLGIVTAAVLAAAACGGSGGGSGGSGGGGGDKVGAPPPSGPALTKSAIKIGNVGTYSGFAGVTSKASADAVQAWAKWTNANGGINGHPVQVVVKDDQGQAASSIAAVKDLVENEKVVAIVGPHDSGLESSWAAYLSAKKIPVIGGSATGATWLSDPNFFPTALTPINYTTVLANTTTVAGKKNYGLVFCAEAPACAQSVTLSQGVTKKLGLNFTGGQPLAASAPNYTAQCLALRKSNAEMIFIGTSQETGLRFTADCTKQNYRPSMVQPTQSWTDDLLKNKSLEGVWLASDAVLWTGGSPAVTSFRQAMKWYSPKSPLNASATSGWTGGVVFGKALANAGDAATAADVVKGLYGLGQDYTADGLIPPVTYTPGKPAVQKPCGWYGLIKNGKLTTPKGSDPVCVGG